MDKTTNFGKKKIISLLLAAIMLAVMIMPLTVSAAVDNVELFVSQDDNIIAGTTQITITVKLTENNMPADDNVQIEVNSLDNTVATRYTLVAAEGNNGVYTKTHTFVTEKKGKYTITATANGFTSSETVKVYQKLPTPTITDLGVSYTAETLTWNTGKYMIGESEITSPHNLTDGLDNGTVSIYAMGDDTEFTKKSDAPLNLSRSDKPSANAGDYTVSGNTLTILKAGLEYSAAENGTYQSIAQNGTLSLAGGSVYLRRAATGATFKSLATRIEGDGSQTGTKETKPNAYIDYSRTEIYNLVAGAEYTINGYSRTANSSGRISVSDFLTSYYQRWDYTYGGYAYDLIIIKKGIGSTTIDSDPQYLTYHTNQGYGYAHLNASNETGQGRNDGYIYGMLSTCTYEYKLSYESSSAYRILPRSSYNSSRSVDLSPGVYDVRIIDYYGNYYTYTQTLTIYPYGMTGWVTLSVPTFNDEYYGYAYRPAERSMTIYNPSSETAYINSVNVSGYSFDIYGSASYISAGSSLSAYTIQPRMGLSSGTYTETVTVTYRIGSSGILYTASAQVYFTVLSDYYDYSYYYGTAKSNFVVDSTTRSSGSISGVLSYYNKADKNGDVNISVTTEAITDAIGRMRNERSKNGKSNDSLDLTLNLTTSGGYSPKAAIELTSDGLRELVSYGVNLAVITDTGSVTFPSNAVRTINSSSSTGCVIKIFKDSKLSTSVSSLVGNRPSVEFKVYGIKNGKMNEVTSFGAQLTLSISYTPGSNEKTGNLGVYKIVGGKALLINKSSYTNGMMTWTGNTLSLYAVGYQRPASEFKDTTDHWAKANIEFVVSRGILTGTDANVFSPDMEITRAMFITALGRLSEENVSSYKGEKNFSDVDKGSVYHQYIEWAYANNIITRGDDGKFDPNRAITREEMAVMIYKYAAYANYKIPSETAAVTFQDADDISANAKEAIKEMQTAGIIQGKGEGVFDPQGKTTRAEASAVLQRFAINIVDAAPERGWVQESANGKWQYINSKGETVKDWQEISGASYYFGNNGYMATGWQTVKGEKYYFDDNGVMAKAKWVKIGEDWYYFYVDGGLAVNTTIDGYKVDSNGVRK